jgi:adenosylmethionine-8-amino-7-oxononanoate aminotransferase
VSAVELVKDKNGKIPFESGLRTGFQIYRKAVENGALLRNLGDIIYFMPPYVISKDEVETLVGIARDSVDEVLG